MNYNVNEKLAVQIDRDLDAGTPHEEIIRRIESYQAAKAEIGETMQATAKAHLNSRIDRHVNGRRQGKGKGKGAAAPVYLTSDETTAINDMVDTLSDYPLSTLTSRDMRIVHTVLCHLEHTEARPYVTAALRHIEEQQAAAEEAAALELLIKRFGKDNLVAHLSQS